MKLETGREVYNTEARSREHCCRANEICIAYSECVFVTLFIQHAKRIILSSVGCLAVPNILYFLKGHD